MAQLESLPAIAEDVGLIPGSGRSPGGGNDNPLHCSCLGNPMDRGAWWATPSLWGLQKFSHVLATEQQQRAALAIFF